MLAVLEAGNTHTVFAVFAGEHVRFRRRLTSDRSRTSDEYGAVLLSLLSSGGLSPRDLHAVAIASVVPALTAALENAAQTHLGLPVTVITPTSNLGIRSLCDPPEAVGVDRLLNTSAAWSRFGGPAIVIDFGTATTFDVVSETGDFLGGAIAPGLKTAAEALTAKAPRLENVELAHHGPAVGRNTVEALQSGIVLGYGLMVDGMIGRMRAELGREAMTIATGGLAEVAAPVCRLLDRFEPDLTLSGIRLAYERSR
jgi:type III pantothenate kinase